MAKNYRKRAVIMGAAGRDFHNFNMVFRNDPAAEVVAFTATQIPGVEHRTYPPSLSGPLYPQGIPIISESELKHYCETKGIEQVIFAYSDIQHADVMHAASIVLATGADFLLIGPQATAIHATVPVIAVSAVRTGCGKSQTCRWIATLLKSRRLNIVVIRHPMPYGDLHKQAVQRFEHRIDLDQANCTIEEREEYEPYIDRGIVVYAGVDYAEIADQAAQEADVILWDGGNNDFPFLKPDLHIVLVDPLRPGHEATYHPGEAVLRMADIALIAKTNAAARDDIEQVTQSITVLNPTAQIIRSESTVHLSDVEAVKDKRALVIEDGPTTTHGGMSYGAAYVAAIQVPAQEIVDPRQGAVPAIQALFAKYPHLEKVLPAVGYFPEQLADLERSINAIDADVVVSATPCDLSKLITCNKPIIRVGYEYTDGAVPNLETALDKFLEEFMQTKITHTGVHL